jgi:mRNA interferase RelE/StbE
MTYRLIFNQRAAKEWGKLDSTVRAQFQAVLIRRLEDPHVPSARLRGRPVRYKIKLRGLGYRLLYEVRDEEVVVLVIAVGRRDSIYDAL